jgi:hypothetical protein
MGCLNQASPVAALPVVGSITIQSQSTSFKKIPRIAQLVYKHPSIAPSNQGG